MMEVITNATDVVNALTTADRYFKIAPVTTPIYTKLNNEKEKQGLPHNSQDSIDVEVVESDLLDCIIAVLEEKKEEIDYRSPTKKNQEIQIQIQIQIQILHLQVQPDTLLKDWHVFMTLHKLLNAHTRTRHNCSTNDC